MQAWLDSVGLIELNELSVAVRILSAMIFGGIIGFERTRKGRPAGLRTYMLVCLASCLVMLAGMYLHQLTGINFDPTRMSAQVLSGIGFLGAGTILVTRHRRVKGLTTAAGLFTVACIGIALGLGFFLGAIITLFACLFIMLFADQLENSYTACRRRMSLSIIFSGIDGFKAFLQYLHHQDMHACNLETFSHSEESGMAICCTVVFPTKRKHSEVCMEFQNVPGVIYTEELDL